MSDHMQATGSFTSDDLRMLAEQVEAHTSTPTVRVSSRTYDRAQQMLAYMQQGKHYPHKRKINKKRLAVVRRKMYGELPTASWLPNVQGAISYRVYGFASGPVRVRRSE